MRLILRILGFLVLLKLCLSQTKQSCFSPVYCQGDLLHVVQTAKIFNDSKTFVDMAMLNSVNETMRQFHNLMLEHDDNPPREKIIDFVSKNFKPVGEFEEYYPRDFKAEPKIVKEISDPVVRKFATSIIGIWPSLTRKVSYQVFSNPDRNSLIPVEQPFVIPGGRFKEYYYWDSYWILKGLLLSDMMETARGMLQNLLSMVERYGFIPNGGRIYYLNRSQPPLITLMVGDYVKVTKDFEFLRNNIKLLDRELHFWLKNRVVEIEKNGTTYTLAHYDSESDTPRPESYLEDIETCSNHKNDEKYECYTDLKAGAESGWDFSSRWIFEKKTGEPLGNLDFINTRRNVPADLNAFLYKSFKAMYKFNMILQKEEEAKFWLEKCEAWKDAINNVLYHDEDGIWYECYTDLQSGAESGWDFTSRWLFDPKGELSADLKLISTRRIVPVDLNSFLYKSFLTMYKFSAMLNDERRATFWHEKAANWKKAMKMVLYHEEDGIWYDYDLKLQKPRRHFFASNFTPLWAGAYDENKKDEYGGKAVGYLKKKGIINYRGGVPSSLFPTGQQWDFPNAWSPYQNLIIIGLDKSGNDEAMSVAKELAHSWVNANIRGFQDNKVMFEKYHSLNSGQFGGGGEYHIQSGFGWSNGCVLELIHLYYRHKTRKYIGQFY